MTFTQQQVQVLPRSILVFIIADESCDISLQVMSQSCAQKCLLQDGWSAILLASVKGHAQVVSHLLAANANVNTPDKVCISGDVVNIVACIHVLKDKTCSF